MKQLFLIIFSAFYLNTTFASNNLLNPVEEEISSIPKTPMDTSFSLPTFSKTYSYFTIGSSVLKQQVGIGRRYKNFEPLKGHDISFIAHFSLPTSLYILNSLYPVFPSIKYSYLNYKDNSPTSQYFGIACEGGFMIHKYYFLRFISMDFIPNIGLIWGKERENMRFSQLQLNVIPAVGLILGMSSFALESGIEGGLVALFSASVLVDYSIAF